MIPDPKRHVEVLGGREELMDGESRPQQTSLHFADKMNGSESKTKPIVFPFFSGEESDESSMFLFSFDLVFVKSMLLSKC